LLQLYKRNGAGGGHVRKNAVAAIRAEIAYLQLPKYAE
jgi:hypothetical protein